METGKIEASWSACGEDVVADSVVDSNNSSCSWIRGNSSSSNNNSFRLDQALQAVDGESVELAEE